MIDIGNTQPVYLWISWICECLGTPFYLANDSAADFQTKTLINRDSPKADYSATELIQSLQPPPSLPRRGGTVTPLLS